jgi:hypothetical protein
MKIREILIIGVFIIVVCVISLIPFSNNIVNESFKGNGNVNGNVTVPPTITANITYNPPGETTHVSTVPHVGIKTNSDFLNAVIAALNKPINKSIDKVSIYKIQGLISSIKSQNAATLLGEIGNPNNLNDPRLFLNYMNWFGSVCPIDSNVCSGIC